MPTPEEPQILLALQVANGYGAQPGAWRMPGTDPSAYTDMDVLVRYAQAAERGKIQLIFLADTPVLDVDLEQQAPHHATDPLVVLASMARGTERIGLVATSSTTLNEPFTMPASSRPSTSRATGGLAGTPSRPPTPLLPRTTGSPSRHARRSTSAPTRSSRSSRRSGAAGRPTPGSATSRAAGSPTCRRSSPSTCAGATWHQPDRSRSRPPSRASR